jgi:hypothetical protein
MSKTITREAASAISDDYKEVLDKETHHNHEIIEDEQGTLRWKEDEQVSRLVDKLNLNDLWALFYSMGIDKNSEHFRKLYRDMGYSLYGYWEIFYWEVNNEDAEDYNPNLKSVDLQALADKNSYEVRACVDNLYMLGGSRGSIEGDEAYKVKMVNHILNLFTKSN